MLFSIFLIIEILNNVGKSLTLKPFSNKFSSFHQQLNSAGFSKCNTNLNKLCILGVSVVRECDVHGFWTAVNRRFRSA